MRWDKKAAVLLLILIGVWFPGNVPKVDLSPVSASVFMEKDLSITKVTQANPSHLTDLSQMASAEGAVLFQEDQATVIYHLLEGTADFYWRDQKVINRFYSAVKLQKTITSKDYTSRSIQKSGNVYTVLLSGGGNPDMKQHFRLQEDGFFTIWIELVGSELATNYMAPIVMDNKGGMAIGETQDVRALWIPFDNDRDTHYDAATIHTEDTSYEAAAFYDNASRKGIIVGSVTHDTWKTGIHYVGSENKLDLLEIYGGASIQNAKHDGMMLRDTEQHGNVMGDILTSPEIFVGFYTDWRDGMEAYAQANAEKIPMRQWCGGVPFGWNSWGAVGKQLNTTNALAASDFVKILMARGFSNDSTTYINLDSYWDSADMDLEAFVSNIKGKGQKAGIYWGPFVDWTKDPSRKVEGSSYSYQDVWLKDKRGNPVTYGNSAYAMDPTHPGTLKRIDYYMDLFRLKGFDAYIKIDFLTHAALEGQHYDATVTTGMQAYNHGMTYLVEAIYSKMGPNTFISQAISPIFPYQYANARRISCDKFGYLYESRDLLNSAAYGWWLDDRLYAFNDPDHMSLYSTWWNRETKISENEAKTRITSAVITGTLFLSGDDFTDPAAREQATKFLTNTRINNIARLGKAFRPVEGNTGTDAPDLFVLDNGNGTWYLAVFNFNGQEDAVKSVDLGRAGLNPEGQYSAIEQWSGTIQITSGIMHIYLEPAEAKMFLMEPFQ